MTYLDHNDRRVFFADTGTNVSCQGFQKENKTCRSKRVLTTTQQCLQALATRKATATVATTVLDRTSSELPVTARMLSNRQHKCEEHGVFDVLCTVSVRNLQVRRLAKKTLGNTVCRTLHSIRQ